ESRATRNSRSPERGRAPDGDEASAGDRRVVVREVALAVHRRDPHRAREVLGHAATARDHRVEQTIELTRPRLDGARMADGADAGDVARERNPPEPAVAEHVDADVAFLETRLSRSALEMSEE